MLLAFVETLKELMFKPSLSTAISENPWYNGTCRASFFILMILGLKLRTSILSLFRVATVSPSDSVYDAAQRMQEFHVNSVLIMTGGKVQGILTYDFLSTNEICFVTS